MSRSSRGPQPSSLLDACLDTLAGVYLPTHTCRGAASPVSLSASALYDLRAWWRLESQRRYDTQIACRMKFIY